MAGDRELWQSSKRSVGIGERAACFAHRWELVRISRLIVTNLVAARSAFLVTRPLEGFSLNTGCKERRLATVVVSSSSQ